MFINLKTDKPAWLLEHDGDVTYSTSQPGEPEASRHHRRVSSYEFFSTHREPSAEELLRHAPISSAGSVSLPMQRTQRAAPSVTPAGLVDDAPKAKPAAKSKAKRKPAAKAKPAADKAAPKEDAKAADKPPASDQAKEAAGDAPPPAHGEQGRD